MGIQRWLFVGSVRALVVTSSDLAARISPALIAALEARRPLILDQAGPAQRVIIRWAWPLLMREVPNISAAAVDAVRSEFGAMTLNDVLTWLGKAGE